MWGGGALYRVFWLLISVGLCVCVSLVCLCVCFAPSFAPASAGFAVPTTAAHAHCYRFLKIIFKFFDRRLFVNRVWRPGSLEWRRWLRERFASRPRRVCAGFVQARLLGQLPRRLTEFLPGFTRRSVRDQRTRRPWLDSAAAIFRGVSTLPPFKVASRGT